MCIRDQVKAIKDCLHRIGWQYVSVKHLGTNPYSRSIKYFLVEFSTKKTKDPFSYEITVMSFGLSDVKSKDHVYLDILNALNKALTEAK